jgi:glutathione S-transferase
VRVWRIPYSTNVERVAIAAGVAGVPVDWVDVEAFDRTPVEEVSGQKGVPVAELDGEIVVGSLAIIGRIAPELWPSAPRPRAQVDVFLDWFERVWMHPLGVLFREGDDGEKGQRAGARLDRAVGRFENLLDGSDHLFGELTVADIAAYPFLKYAKDDELPDDDYEIHRLMRRYQSLDGRPRVAAWLERVAARPQA